MAGQNEAMDVGPFQVRLPVHDCEKPCTGIDLMVRDNPRSAPRLPIGAALSSRNSFPKITMCLGKEIHIVGAIGVPVDTHLVRHILGMNVVHPPFTWLDSVGIAGPFAGLPYGSAHVAGAPIVGGVCSESGSGLANATWIDIAKSRRTLNKKRIIFFIQFSPFKTYSFESLLVCVFSEI